MPFPKNTQHIRAKKSLGQNFLQDTKILQTIRDATIIEHQNIIEVGPGYGALTQYILEKNPKTLDLVELDTDMVSLLNSRIIDEWRNSGTQIHLHHHDVLQFFPNQLSYTVIANIPYYITSPILFHFLYSVEIQPNEMIILMQKEVGEKILKNTKKNKFSYLSLAMHQVCESIEKITEVPRTAFHPIPKVDSIVLKFVLKKERDKNFENEMLHFWNQAFEHPRKTLQYNLKKSGYSGEKILEILEKKGYSQTVRAQAINQNDWNDIYEFLQKS